MRLKTFTAPSMPEAMRLVRDQLGPDAIIVSSQPADKGKGVIVTAAIEQAPEPAVAAPHVTVDPVERMTETLANHGAPGPIADRLLAVVAKALSRTSDPAIALGAALDSVFGFAPLGTPEPTRRGGRPLMLVGPPAVGKTVTVAKLAARAVMARKPVMLVTMDTRRAGAVDQLAAFARVLKVDLGEAADAEGLRHFLRSAGDQAVIIDTPGANPFNAAEMAEIAAAAESVHAEPVLLMPAGLDVADSAEIAEAFAAIGAGRMIATRVDLARRLGGLLSAAQAGRLAFAEVSVTPQIADGLTPLNPVALARLLLPWAAKAETDRTSRSSRTSSKQAAAS
jgi:flagellar biosynthesis protein FlhF